MKKVALFFLVVLVLAFLIFMTVRPVTVLQISCNPAVQISENTYHIACKMEDVGMKLVFKPLWMK